MKQKRSFDEALELVARFIAMIDDTVDRVAIAGSLRRGKDPVGDGEVVVRPRYDGAANLLELRMDALLYEGAISKRVNRKGHDIAWGKAGQDSRYKAFTFEGLPIDLFIVLPDRQWGPTYLIRTGSGEANQALVTSIGKHTHDGIPGVLPVGLRFEDGALWKGNEQLDTPEEVDVFRACGLPWVPPHLRNPQVYMAARNYAPDHWRPTCGHVWRYGAPVSVDGVTEFGQPGLWSEPVRQLGLF